MKKLIIIILSFLIVTITPAQVKGNEIRVVVSPDKKDWKYDLGEKCTFTISVFKAQNLLSDAVIDYELGPEMFPSEVKKGIVLKDGTLKLSGVMKQPGFLSCKIKAHSKGYSYEGMAKVGYAPEKIEPYSKYPDDFMDFWKGKLEEARKTPLEPRFKLLAEKCNDTDNFYEVSYNCKSGMGRIYGILTVPKKEGKYPALLRLPGAGVRPYFDYKSCAPGKVIMLEMNIHGFSVTLDDSVYDDMFASILGGYWDFESENRDKTYYNRVIIGTLRSVDFLCSLPQFNNDIIGVTGSSQGGALSVITAALDDRIDFLAALHPALCDHEAFLNGRAGGWPHYYYNNKPSKKKIETLRYYDVVNFAKNVSTPSWFSWGYNDEVCTPSSMYAAYNSITAPKELHLYLETGHFWYQEQFDEWQEWLREKLRL